MKLIYNPVFLEHETGSHPESKSRLLAMGEMPVTEILSGESYLSLVHTLRHIEEVKQSCEKGSELDPDTLTSGGSFHAASMAVGAAIRASETGGFALVRPPGHHAYAEKASGFCLFNNIAIAVKKLVDEGKRVFILDFDGHYGDGTADIFYNTDKVLYGSVHQYPAFPGHGWVDEIGEGEGEGYNICVPLPPDSGDDLFFEALDRLVKAGEKFGPDVVAVSAGFDAHKDDPLLQLNITNNSFYLAGKMLSQRFDNIFACLEGGYNIDVLPSSIRSFLEGVNGEKHSNPEAETVTDDFIIAEFHDRMRKLENCLPD